MKSIPDNVSAVYHKLVALFFDATGGRDISLSGCQVTLANGRSMTIFADIAVAIADEAALHAMYGCKGSSGLRPCLLCVNVYNPMYGSEIVERDPSRTSVCQSCSDIDLCKRASTDVLQAVATKLKSSHATLGVGAFKELEIRLGWKFQPHGVMYDEKFKYRLCPSKILVFDWMHILFVGGVFNNHGGLLLRSLRTLKISPERVGNYVKMWHWPHHISVGVCPGDVFNEDRLRSSMAKGELKCTASEGLSLVAVLAQFCEGLLTHRCSDVRKHARCFLDLAKVVSCIVLSGRQLTDRSVLKTRAKCHLDSFKAVYSEDECVPKFHYLLHLSTFESMPNCFVHERKHKNIKRWANQLFNTTGDWDASVLREVTSLHIAKLAAATAITFAETPGLVEPRAPSKKIAPRILDVLGPEFAGATLQTSRKARVNKYQFVSVGDLVLLGSVSSPTVGRVVLHVSVAVDELLEHATLVEEYAVTADHQRCWKCRLTGTQTLFAMEEIVCGLVWAGDDILTILKPLHVHRYADI